MARVCMALWLGIIALAANAFEQQQLTTNILVATAADPAPKAGFHVMPDGTAMAGSMVHADGPSAIHRTTDADGHTHRGHADCEICGTVAAMAAFTLPSLPEMPLPLSQLHVASPADPQAAHTARPYSPYASRAPPALTI